MNQLGNRLGCASAFLFAVAISFPMLFGLLWAGNHCEPVPDCRRQNEQHFGLEIAIVIFVALSIGLVARWVVNRLSARRGDGGTSATFVAAATIGILGFAGLAVWFAVNALKFFLT